MNKIKISNAELARLLNAEAAEFPKYVTQIINLANQNAQGTRPKVVGQMSELVSKSKARSIIEWQNWYSLNHPTAIEEATKKIWAMIKLLKEAIEKINEEMVKKWAEDLVIVKTYVGLRFQEAILRKVAEHLGRDFKTSTPKEESQGIDGWIGSVPVSIKPDTYKIMKAIPEEIQSGKIYYSKKKDGISIEFENI